MRPFDRAAPMRGGRPRVPAHGHGHGHGHGRRSTAADRASLACHPERGAGGVRAASTHRITSPIGLARSASFSTSWRISG